MDIHIFCCDLARESDREKLITEIQTRPFAVGWLVNNAGIGQFGTIAEAPWQQTEQMLKLNMLGVCAAEDKCRPIFIGESNFQIGRSHL
ncbi:SDR family NAD(P)-dependent oxidoreductase [Mariprofundus erugo]|uniref:SDR family NAD(P)-dependent oxidoreductase n=1 Tax=Mariprofundus erugo TaxID=2528639 RepID=A0A5R9GJS9_9PROT|nr:SDR family NAD(P)-dependent oxidoreductase [Mariprofundus erugo]